MSAPARLLIQVVPRLTPGRCGVSDQAVLLAQDLKSEFKIESTFAVLNSKERSGVPQQVVYCTPSQLLATCLTLTGNRPGAILVHLSGYGYSANGAPELLADAVAQIEASGKFRVAVYFHELFANSMPWRKAFWFSRRQRRAVRRIAEECDLLVTNTRQHADWLESEPARRRQTPVQVLPVLSGAGEAQEPAPLASREPVLAVFGLPGSRQRAYREISASNNLLESLGIRDIFDIGPEFNAPSALGRIPVRRMGEQSAEDLADLFSRLAFGFVPHAPNCLAKSSIFASYCAQGIIPVLARSLSGEVDGLRDGIHFVSPKTVKIVLTTGLEGCSRAAWHWYAAHRRSAHGEFYAHWLEQVATGARVTLPPFQQTLVHDPRNP